MLALENKILAYIYKLQSSEMSGQKVWPVVSYGNRYILFLQTLNHMIRVQGNSHQTNSPKIWNILSFT